MNFVSKYKGTEIEQLLDKINNLPNNDELKKLLSSKVDTILGYGLTEVNFTKELYEKLLKIMPSDVLYNNEFKTVKDALDYLLYGNNMYIKEFKTNILQLQEVGSEVYEVVFNYDYNLPPKSTLTIEPLVGQVSGNEHVLSLSNPIKETTTFTLTADNEGNTVEAQTTIQFVPRMFWGISDKEEITSIEILSWKDNSALQTDRKITNIFNCQQGKYIYFCIPQILCSGMVEFYHNGIESDFVLTEDLLFKNKYNTTTPMNIYRSLNKLHGSAIKVTVE